MIQSPVVDRIAISDDSTVASVLRLTPELLAEFDEITGSILYGFDARQTLQKDGSTLRSAVSLKPPEQVLRAFSAARRCLIRRQCSSNLLDLFVLAIICIYTIRKSKLIIRIDAPNNVCLFYVLLII